ncbi:MAG: hypothetical protein ACRD2W_16595 [Acidimicrobiales bacterium]
MAFLDGGASSLRKTWARLRSSGQASETGLARPLRWHAQPLAPKVDVEDKAAVLAALERR